MTRRVWFFGGSVGALPDQCRHCWRPGIAIVYRRRGPLAVILGRPRRSYRVCLDHVPGRHRV